MSDLIRKQAALVAVKDALMALSYMPKWRDEKILEAIAELPSAQPEIIRCRECKWKQGAECVRFADVRPFADDFCSRAERRTDG